MELVSDMNAVAVISKDESCSLTALEGVMMCKPLILYLDLKIIWITKALKEHILF